MERNGIDLGQLFVRLGRHLAVAVCAAGLLEPAPLAAQCPDYPGAPPLFDCVSRDGLEDSPDFISPPTVNPIVACSEAVSVSGIVTGATVTIYQFAPPNPTPLLWSTGTGTNPWDQVFLGPSLFAGDILFATQEMPGDATSPPSPMVTVQSPPSPLSMPFVYGPMYECGGALRVTNVVPGSQVTATHETVGTLLYNQLFPWSAATLGLSPGDIPSLSALLPDNELSAFYTTCGAPSPSTYPPLEIQPLPAGWDETYVPALVGPLYEGQEYVEVDESLYGMYLTVVGDASTGGLGVALVPNGVATVRVDPLVEGEEVFVVGSFCAADTEPSPLESVLSCEELPPPLIRVPRAGDSSVEVLQGVPGARIFVFADDGGGVFEEIGDGSGRDILLSRRIYPGDELRVIQRVGDCYSEDALAVTAPCIYRDELSTSTDATELFAASSALYDLGDNYELPGSPTGARIAGEIYYPSTEEDSEVVPGSGQFPLVVMMHGNHSSHQCTLNEQLCENTSYFCDFGTVCVRNIVAACPGPLLNVGAERELYRGYDSAARALARAGHVVASINANDLCGDFVVGGTGGPNVNERVELFRAHLRFLRDGDILGFAPALSSRIDFDRVVVAGHSRGGEAAVRVSELGGVSGVTILGTVAVAPSSFLHQGSTVNPVAMIVGNRDHDTGPALQDIYDRSSSAEFRSILTVDGANHNWWNSVINTDDAALLGGTPVLSRSDQERVLTPFFVEATGSILAPQSRSHFSGLLTGGAGFAGYTTYFQYGQSDELSWHRFDSATNDLGGTATPAGFDSAQYAVCGDGSPVEPESFLGSSTGVWLAWSAPDPVFEEEMGGFDHEAYSWLSVRFAQVSDPGSMMSQPPLGFSVISVDDGATSRVIPIEPAFSRAPPVYGLDTDAKETISQWSTLRIPTACVVGPTAVDNGDSLAAIQFVFSDEEGWVTVDDLVLQR